MKQSRILSNREIHDVSNPTFVLCAKVNDYLCKMAEDITRIKRLLDDQHDWPAVFMFKFVVPSDNQRIAQVEGLFNTKTAEVRRKPSSKGNYTALTIKEVMVSADAVLSIYKEAAKIEGLIAL